MLSDIDDQIPETNRQHVRLTQQLIGVVGEEEYFARQEVERKRKRAEERQVRIPAKANTDSGGNANGIPGRRRTVLGA